ncbi:MAG: APC family permease [Caldisphaeraceae archaeon]|nr:APC family permease [Caldisphaeraceae archaeon]
MDMEGEKNVKTNYLRLKRTLQLKKQLSFTDLLFLSLEGQAPFLTLLTYATSVILYSLLFSPFLIIVGALIVLVNGLIVYKLSRMYVETGGYYIYALYSLTRRLGLETGWMYIFYSAFYGTAYLIGSTFILHYVLGLNAVTSLLVVFIPSIVFLLSGLKPSARYAEISGISEIILIFIIFVIGIYMARFHFFNPFVKIPPLNDIALALLFAIGIPTGYGTIIPLSGETINTKDIGKAVLLVIMLGAVIESLGVYGLIDMGIYTHQFSLIFHSQVPILDLLRTNFGIYALVVMVYAAVSDGILSALSFMIGTSRTIYAMAQKDMLPSIFTWLRNNQPILASLLTIFIYGIILVPSILTIKNPFYLFIELGAIAGLANLFVHLSANFSLFFTAIRQIKKRVLSGMGLAGRVFSSILSKISDLTLSSIAIGITLLTLLYSLQSVDKLAENIFMGWIIVGFLYAEIVENYRELKYKDIKNSDDGSEASPS